MSVCEVCGNAYDKTMDVIVGGVFDIAPMRPARRRSAIVLENTVSDVDVAALA